MLNLSLRGVRILDLTRLAPGPYASLAMADLGAEVVKVEEPARGDPLRYLSQCGPDLADVLFDHLNRNKKSIALNLKTAQGRAILLQLVHGSDVLMEGLRPGTMERLGLGYDDVSEVNPGLIYASISGYGQTGPHHLQAGHDLDYIALGGLLELTGWPDDPPAVPGVPVADLVSGLWTALGIVAALRERTHSGRGQYLDISMLDCVVSLLQVPLADWLASGSVPRRGRMPLGGRLACYNVYETGDGQHMALAALEHHFWEAFCLAVGRPDWVERQQDPDQGPLIADVSALFLAQSRDYWSALFATHDCCCEPVLAIDEVFAHPQVRHRGLLHGQSLATPLVFQSRPPAPAPRLGQHTTEILGELGYEADDVRRLRRQGVI